MNDQKKTPPLSPATQVTRLGQSAQCRVNAINTPVWRASTVLFPDFAAFEAAERGESRGESRDGITYGLHGLPTVQDIGTAVAALEGGHAGLAVPSGLTATTLPLLALLKAGDHVLVVDAVYSPTRRFCERTLKRYGVEVGYYDPLIGADIVREFRPNTKVVFLESPGSLTFEVQDVPAIAGACRQRGIITIIDNTWATPLGFRAFDHGVDISVHAATKFIGGHSDVLLGVISCNEATYPQIRRQWTDMGVTPSPDDCYLALRGLRTMAMRLAQHEKSGLCVAQWLQEQPGVGAVLYPALPGAPGHELWKRDFRHACGVFSFMIHETSDAALARMLDGLRLFRMGYSWGGFTSLITPFDPHTIRSATRWTLPGRALRIAVGLEDADDLIADLAAGLRRLRGG